MAAERFYIYRIGSTDACALTASKGDPRLPTPALDGWQFWMQVGRLQVEDGRYGFDIQAAVVDIAAKGYFLFTGSRKLLGASLTLPPTASAEGGTSDV
jgi:hypothetical protein